MLLTAGYETVEELFNNDATVIYRAQRIADKKNVIIKTLNKNFPSSKEIARVKREFEFSKYLTGIEGVRQVYELLEDNNSLMLISEDFGGHPLKKLFLERDNNSQEIDIEERLAIAVKMANAISHIHQHGIIHKDIPPDNIVYNAKTEQVKIIDFGISSLSSSEQLGFQNHNELEGKLDYMSPEQTGRINKTIDHRSDLYSFGITLFQLFTSVLPFKGCKGIELVHAHIAKNPVSAQQLNSRLPLSLTKIIARLLSKMADERYQTAKGLSHDLALCLQQLKRNSETDFSLGELDKPTKLQLHQHLYGREEEVKLLLNSFKQVSQNGSEIVLISGLSGTGKSALVNEVHRPLTEKNGIFISGKFEQNQKNIPFSAWRQVFSSLAIFILKENKETLEYWRALIQNALGDNGQVLIDTIPRFELIIGHQPAAPPLSGTQAQHRFNYVINQFINTIALAKHPLVIFIDDWQWADKASLDLLESIVKEDTSESLLFIGAYRDNEISTTHAFSLTLEAIKRSPIQCEYIHIDNLLLADIENLVSDAMQNANKVQELSKLVYDKTQGNAFFAIQFLEMLEHKHLLQFDLQQNGWSWEMDKLNDLNITNNVVELMVDKIKQLPETSQQALKYAACIGNKFQLAELAHILNISVEQARADTNLPIKEGILRYAKNTYSFIHDHVQQAAYSIFSEQNRIEVHYKIALTLLEKLSGKEQEEHLYDIVRHLNIGKQHITSNKEKKILSRLNFQAGKRAIQVTAYSAAIEHFIIAIEALLDNCWDKESHTTTIALYTQAAETAYLLNQFDLMEAWLEKVLNKAKTPIEKAQAWAIRLQAYTAQNRLSEAVTASLSALKVLGIEIPHKPNDFQVIYHLIKTKYTLRGHTPQELLSLPPMENPQQLLAMNILGLTIPAAYWTSPNLVAMIIFKLTQNSVIKGYAPISGYAFSWWGITECAMLGNIDSGFDFGELGIKLAQTNNLYLQQPIFFSGWMINNYKHPLKDSIAILNNAYSISLEKGDFEYASYALNNKVQHKLHLGEPLNQLLPEMKKSHQTLKQLKMASSQFWHDICWQLTLNLSELEEAPSLLAGKAYDEAKHLPQHLKENDASTLFFLYFSKLMQSYLLNDTSQALVNIQKIKPYLKAGMGTFQHRLFYFYESLTLLAHIEKSSYKKVFILIKVRANQRKLKNWAKYSPENHLHHWHLVQAEYMRVLNKANQAVTEYNRAIELASINNFIHEEALSYELFTKFHIRHNQKRFAQHDLIQAHYLYSQWGERGKAQQLEKQYANSYPQILSYSHSKQTHGLVIGQLYTQQAHSEGYSSIRSLSTQLDLESIIKSSQLISSEIVFSDLIKTLSKIIIENAGAQRFLMLKIIDNNPVVEAESILINEKVISNPIDYNKHTTDKPAFPESLANFVLRTQQSVTIDDILEDDNFQHDSYFKTNAAKSVFCGPILHQGQLTGIIYLENAALAGVFTNERIELIQLLASQAAISIENSKLYSNLENKVIERTQQLEVANKQLTLLATTDNLTTLSNRRQFNERIELEVGRAKRNQEPVSLLLCDVDYFKKFNDCYGHVDGDDCLKRIGQVFNQLFNRTADLPARYGGEEFAVILPATNEVEAIKMAEKLCKDVQQLKIPHKKNTEHNIVTISVGCHTFTPSVNEDVNPQVESLLRQADKALYQAKESGRNCVKKSI